MSLPPDFAKFLNAVPGWAGASGSCEPLAGGLTNRNFRVQTGEGVFVLRIAGAGTSALGIDRVAEVLAARAAASAGVGPEVVAVLENNAGLVTRFLPGTAIPPEEVAHEATLCQLTESLRRLHAGPPLPVTFDVFRIVERYRAAAAAGGVATPSAAARAQTLAQRIETALKRSPSAVVPCHNDLLVANFLRGPDRIWIVDYEYAGMGDPFFDLGNLSINNSFDAAADERLLQLYCGRVDDLARARLALMRLMSDLREAMWGVAQQALSELDFDYAAYAEHHFARLLKTAENSRCEQWLEAFS